MTNSLADQIAVLLGSAKTRVIIISAFIRSETLRFLLSEIKSEVKVQIFARWRFSDLAAGASDIEVIDVAKEKESDFKVYDALHAKIYIADNRALVGSANATDTGLGRKLNSNLELMVETSAQCPQIEHVLTILEKNAAPPLCPSNDVLKHFQNLLKDIKNDEHNNLSENWLPSSLPEDILSLNQVNERVSDNTIKDCIALKISPGISKSRLTEVVRKQKIFVLLDKLLEKSYDTPLSSERIISFLCVEFSLEKEEAKFKWELLKAWIDSFAKDMYISPSHHSNNTELRRGRKVTIS